MTDSSNNTDSADFLVHCAWLLNPDEPPRQHVRILVQDGIVADICDVPADERSMMRPEVVTPRFVNAHTHLEFSQLQNPLQPSQPFPDWIRSVIRYRTQHPEPKFFNSAIDAGAHECVSCGTSLIGEISTSDDGHRALAESVSATGMSAVSFRELIGFRAESIDAQLAIAETFLSVAKSHNVPGTVAGLSPHAPYSVHPELLAGIVDCAIRHAAPLAMHLAETQDELELLHSRSGRFVDFLKSMDLWQPESLGGIRSVLPYLEKLAQNRTSLAVHCNYLSSGEIEFLGNNPHVAVVYCPRTHAYFGHPIHPWRKLMAAGATVILGTDSRASNPDLSIWRELQHMARQPEAPAIWELLPAITTHAAAALGCSDAPFRISAGTPFAATRIPCDCRSASRLNLALQASTAVPVVA